MLRHYRLYHDEEEKEEVKEEQKGEEEGDEKGEEEKGVMADRMSSDNHDQIVTRPEETERVQREEAGEHCSRLEQEKVTKMICILKILMINVDKLPLQHLL